MQLIYENILKNAWLLCIEQKKNTFKISIPLFSPQSFQQILGGGGDADFNLFIKLGSLRVGNPGIFCQVNLSENKLLCGTV